MVQTIEQLYLKLTSAPGGTLVSASTPAARIAQIHEMSMKGAVMIMREAAPVALPAGRTVSLAPNGAHIMLIELAHPLAAGELITVTLILIVDDAQKKRERLEVAARVEALPPATSRPGTRRRS
jgi:copper(I)-binding protein